MRRRKEEKTNWEIIELLSFESGGITKAYALEILHLNNIRATTGGYCMNNGWGSYTIKVDSDWVNKALNILGENK